MMNSGARPEGSSPWIDLARGVVSREAFVSDEVYDRELAQIFETAWVFLAHETELPDTGNYVTRTLGNAPVVVVRDAGGVLRAVLNSCRHRGAKICRADAGTATRFVCPYHGWSFERDGRLITTTFDHLLPADLDFGEWGLIRVPRLESYKGFIFGSWNAEVGSLEAYLGDFKFYLDAFVGRTPGGLVALAPPHRWRSKVNWKVGSLNFIGDGQHTSTTHIGPLTLDAVRSAKRGLTKRGDSSVQVIVDGGHGLTLSYLAEGLEAIDYQTHSSDLLPLYASTLPPRQLKLLTHLRAAVGTVFPNLSFIESQAGPGQKALIFRLWHPISGSEMEVLSWVFAEREASDDYKRALLKKGIHNFGAAGVFEQDDLELWESATLSSRSRIARQHPFSFLTALPFLDKPLPDYDGPGRAFRPSSAEVIQLEFMRHWERLMMAGAEQG